MNQVRSFEKALRFHFISLFFTFNFTFFNSLSLTLAYWLLYTLFFYIIYSQIRLIKIYFLLSRVIFFLHFRVSLTVFVLIIYSLFSFIYLPFFFVFKYNWRLWLISLWINRNLLSRKKFFNLFLFHSLTTCLRIIITIRPVGFFLFKQHAFSPLLFLNFASIQKVCD